MTPAFARFVLPARATPELWRLPVALVFVGGAHLGWLYLLAGALRGTLDWADVIAGQTPAAMAALLAGFCGLIVGLWAAVRIVHRRGFSTLIGPGPQALRQFVIGALVLLLVYGVGGALWVSLVGGPVAGLSPQTWLVWLLPLVVLLVIQTGAEELIFRGYLQQQLAARFQNRLVWLILPSVAFGMLHYEPETMRANAWLVVAATALFGLVAADLTARTGSLGMAWGLHFANNFVALLLLAPSGEMSGASLMRWSFGYGDEAEVRGMLLFDMALLLVVWAVARRVLAVTGREGAGG